MSAGMFDFAPLLPAGLPPAAARWTGLAKYSFVGGNNDPEQVPVDGLIDAVNAVLKREGKALATYGLASGPQGYHPLREFLVGKLNRDAGIACTADDILIVSGSLQALDLVNHTLLARGDTVIIEQDTYQGALNRLTRLGVNTVGVPLDGDGMRMDALAAALQDLKRKNIRPKYIYTIPTVQNPTGTIMPEPRRLELLKLSQQYGVPIFEDDCYADLIWTGERPPAIYAMSRNGGVIHIGLQIHRAGIAGRFYRGALGSDVAHAGAEDRCRLRGTGADGAGRILRAAFHQPCAEADTRIARKARHADGGAQRTIRYRGRI
jgi:2-aminoadipate transaminase